MPQKFSKSIRIWVDYFLTHRYLQGLAAIAGILGLVIAFIPRNDPTPIPPPFPSPVVEKIEIPQYKIWFDEKNPKKVHRNVIKDEAQINIQWVIKHNAPGQSNSDRDMKINALSETYREHHRTGHGVYTVYLEAFIDDKYIPVSNVLTYSIP